MYILLIPVFNTNELPSEKNVTITSQESMKQITAIPSGCMVVVFAGVVDGVRFSSVIPDVLSGCVVAFFVGVILGSIVPLIRVLKP